MGRNPSPGGWGSQDKRGNPAQLGPRLLWFQYASSNPFGTEGIEAVNRVGRLERTPQIREFIAGLTPKLEQSHVTVADPRIQPTERFSRWTWSDSDIGGSPDCVAGIPKTMLRYVTVGERDHGLSL